MKTSQMNISAGRLAAAHRMNLLRARARRFSQRLWERDATLWKSDEEHARVIANRLGWLDSPLAMKEVIPEIEHFVRSVRNDLLDTVVLLGMGGSSLAPEVFAQVFAPGHFGQPEGDALHLHVVDSTDPMTISRLRATLDLERTLFLVSSKSGGTIETRSQLDYFWAEAGAALGEGAAKHFVAITDAGSGLESLARERGFREVFRNASDIGGRYSVLSYFGLVPAALVGAPLGPLLESAGEMIKMCRKADVTKNPALQLAALLAVGWRYGIDKLTFLCSDSMAPLVPWIEQLVAESLGKEGVGIVPIEGERPGPLAEFGPDRLFVRLALVGEEPDDANELFQQARVRHEPCAEILATNRLALAGEFMRWELATAWTGAFMELDPFDEPNVTESKEYTSKIMADWETYAEEDRAGLRREEGPYMLHADEANWQRVLRECTVRNLRCEQLEDILSGFLGLVRGADYLALLAYVDRNDESEEALAAVRTLLRARMGLPVLRGYGPRFLHSIGQLYKGGGDQGLFVQITHDPGADLPIPGRPYTFGRLEAAQAMGDFLALSSRGRRVVRLHLPEHPAQPLAELAGLFERALDALGL